ncbi:uncharacterized protein LOC135369333 [Ornithodoros turicata]|uniref:uncharacterized protein LOC135369333 n=1 Tax=Ornithodoros turicata TaxID=34597 RepID=UPI003139ADDA
MSLLIAARFVVDQTTLDVICNMSSEKKDVLREGVRKCENMIPRQVRETGDKHKAACLREVTGDALGKDVEEYFCKKRHLFTSFIKCIVEHREDLKKMSVRLLPAEGAAVRNAQDCMEILWNNTLAS